MGVISLEFSQLKFDFLQGHEGLLPCFFFFCPPISNSISIIWRTLSWRISQRPQLNKAGNQCITGELHQSSNPTCTLGPKARRIRLPSIRNPCYLSTQILFLPLFAFFSHSLFFSLVFFVVFFLFFCVWLARQKVSSGGNAFNT